jgi:hypothetical protein
LRLPYFAACPAELRGDLFFFFFLLAKVGFSHLAAEVLAFRRGGQDAEKSQNDQPTNLAVLLHLL